MIDFLESVKKQMKDKDVILYAPVPLEDFLFVVRHGRSAKVVKEWLN